LAKDLPLLTFADAGAFERWLADQPDDSPGAWLRFAKQGAAAQTVAKTDAIDSALAHGWIDGQTATRDGMTYRERFTPRRARSRWSTRNVGIVGRLRSEGRMHPAGEAEVERAQADGRWDAAYAGAASAEVPPDLAAALSAQSRARAMFEILTSQNRYAILYRVQDAKKPETRARRIARFVEMLSRGEKLHP